MKKISVILIFIFLLSVINSYAIERRGPQFLSESSYLIFPLPYSLAGIGKGVMVTALAGNVYDTNVDAYAIGITGDAQGAIVAIEDIHIIPEFLVLDVMHQYLNKATVNNYDKRGMNTNRNDYSLIGVDKVLSDYAQLTLTLFDRRLEVYGAYDRQKARIISMKDSQGVTTTDLLEPFISESESRRLGLTVDYTDDRLDPKKGIRFNAEYISSPGQSDSAPEFFTIDKSLTFYLPLERKITLALNIFSSDAYVTKTGETNPDVLKGELGIGCNPIDLECLKMEEGLVQMFIDSNTNGTATALGGERRLRSYPGNRYNGAHSLYYAAELRWNLSEKVRPFNFGIWKDVATGLQIAAFYERGSVSEEFSELGDISRSSYGGGLRLVSASGFVYRADYASGDEGSELTVMFSYPW